MNANQEEGDRCQPEKKNFMTKTLYAVGKGLEKKENRNEKRGVKMGRQRRLTKDREESLRAAENDEKGHMIWAIHWRKTRNQPVDKKANQP